MDYVRTDEMGLSSIIADLLNPAVTHSQGNDFLKKFLDLLKKKRHCKPGIRLEECRISVRREQVIPIIAESTLSFTSPAFPLNMRWRLKTSPIPMIRTPDSQLLPVPEEKYLKFLLIYLLPTGKGPTKDSVSRQELVDREREYRFVILRNQNEPDCPFEDEFKSYRTKFALTDWLEECHKDCEVDRLR